MNGVKCLQLFDTVSAHYILAIILSNNNIQHRCGAAQLYMELTLVTKWNAIVNASISCQGKI